MRGGSSECDHLWNWFVQKIHRQREKTSTPTKTPFQLSKETSAAVSVTGGMQMKQLFPLVSMKSWRVMAFGSTWCSRKGRMSARPTKGRSTDPQVSASQCTMPEVRSAATNPSMNALAARKGNSSSRSANRRSSQAIAAAKQTMLATSNRRTAGPYPSRSADPSRCWICELPWLIDSPRSDSHRAGRVREIIAKSRHGLVTEEACAADDLL